jgi:hypothetical protein
MTRGLWLGFPQPQTPFPFRIDFFSLVILLFGGCGAKANSALFSHGVHGFADEVIIEDLFFLMLLGCVGVRAGPRCRFCGVSGGSDASSCSSRGGDCLILALRSWLCLPVGRSRFFLGFFCFLWYEVWIWVTCSCLVPHDQFFLP